MTAPLSRGYCARCGTWPTTGHLVDIVEVGSGVGPAYVEPDRPCADVHPPARDSRHPTAAR